MKLTRRSMMLSTSAAAMSMMGHCCRVAASQTDSACESRAILDEGLHWSTPDGAERVIRRIKRAGFNVFIPCVWHGGGACWPSKLIGWDSRLLSLAARTAGYDPLAYLLQIAAKNGIQVHPWFTVGRRAGDILPQYAREPQSTTFNLYDEKFREFMAGLVLEVVRRYEIQGVNLDYVRFGSPVAAEAVERERVVADVIRRVRDDAKRLRPELLVSCDAAPWEPTMKQFGQDAVKWADEELVDVAYSMQYQPEPAFDVTARLQASMRHPERLVVIVGNFDRIGPDRKVVPRDTLHLARLIEQARQLSAGNGVAVYYYGMLSDEQIDALRVGAFRQGADACWTADGR